jgi:hypothetical protein
MATGTTRRTSLNTFFKEALLWPKITDPDTLSADLHAMAVALENDAETFQVKIFTERPEAKLRGRFCYIEEGFEKGLYWDTGTEWVLLIGSEVAHLNVTETLSLPIESITNADLHKESITDTKIIAGKALIDTENTYVVGGEVVGTEYEPSATRMTFVALWATIGVLDSMAVFVGGEEIGEFHNSSGTNSGIYSYSFLCPPKLKWKVTGAGITFLKSKYFIL